MIWDAMGVTVRFVAKLCTLRYQDMSTFSEMKLKKSAEVHM